MRLLLAIPIFLVATLLFLVSISEYSSSASKSRNESIQKTIDKNIIIDKAFRVSASYVDGFYNLNKRYPTSPEYEAWATKQPEDFYHPSDIRFFSDAYNYPSVVIDRFGQPSDNSFMLVLWRGEWNEYYVSWKGKTTLSFDIKDYEFSFGAFLFMISISLFTYFLSALIGSRRLQEKIKYIVSVLSSSYLSPSTYKNIVIFISLSKQYIKILLCWVSVGALFGFLMAVGGGVGPGSYIIWLGVIAIFIVFSIIHCIAILS